MFNNPTIIFPKLESLLRLKTEEYKIWHVLKTCLAVKGYTYLAIDNEPCGMLMRWSQCLVMLAQHGSGRGRKKDAYLH